MWWGIVALIGFLAMIPVVSWAERGRDATGGKWMLAGMVLAVTLVSGVMCVVSQDPP